MYIGYLWPFSFQSIWGSCRALNCPKMTCNSTRAGFRVKASEIWDPGRVVTCIMGTSDLLVLNAILRSFGALVSKSRVTRKRLTIEQNGLKFVFSWYLWYVFGVPTCNLLAFNYILGSFGTLVPKLHVTQKRLVEEQTRVHLESGLVVICIKVALDFLVFNVILRSFSALFSNWLVTRKWERNVGPGGSCDMYLGVLLSF